MGVDKAFLNNMFKKYGKYSSKLGLDTNNLKSMVDNLGNAINANGPNKNTTNPSVRKTDTRFDSSIYPRV